MNDESIFLKAVKRPAPLTFLMVEYLSKRKDELDGDEDVTFSQVLNEACRVCSLPDPTEDQMVYLLARLNGTDKKHKKPEDEEQAAKKVRANRDFGGNLAEWLESMSPQEVCLWLAEYDMTSAAHLYSFADMEDVKEMVQCKAAQIFQEAKVSMEASLFGFGGGYKKTPSANTNVYDLSGEDGEDAQEAAFKKLEEIGF